MVEETKKEQPTTEKQDKPITLTEKIVMAICFVIDMSLANMLFCLHLPRRNKT